MNCSGVVWIRGDCRLQAIYSTNICQEHRAKLILTDFLWRVGNLCTKFRKKFDKIRTAAQVRFVTFYISENTITTALLFISGKLLGRQALFPWGYYGVR